MALKAISEYARGIRTSIRSNAGAYGYSVLITGTLAMLASLRSQPEVGHLFLFGAGAATGFAAIEAVGSNFFRDRMRGDGAEVVVLGSAFSFVSISAGLGAAALVGWLVGGWVPWVLGPFAATVTYLLVLGIELSLARRAEEGHRRG